MTRRSSTKSNANEFYNEIENIAKEKNISTEIVLECFKRALIIAYRSYIYKSEGTTKEDKRKDKTNDVNLTIARNKNQLEILIEKKVVKKPEFLLKEISLKDAKKIKEDVQLDDTILVPVDYSNFPSTVVRSAIDSFTNEIQNYVGNKLYEEYKKLEGSIVIGKIHRIVKGTAYVYLDESKIEAYLPPEEKSPLDDIKVNESKKFLIKLVKSDSVADDNDDKKQKKEKKKAVPTIILSRNDPKFVQRLIESESEEVARKEVEVVKIVREPGYKTKVAVSSKIPGKDPVGTVLGKNSSRISNVRLELGGEVIEVVQYSPNEIEYIQNALNVSKFGYGKIIKVKDTPEEKRCIFVLDKDSDKDKIVGKSGNNVRLASRLTGWKIDVKTRNEFENSEIYKLISKDIDELFAKQTMTEEKEELEEIGEDASITVLQDQLGNEIIKKLQNAGIDLVSTLIDWHESHRLQTINSLSPSELLTINRFIEQNVEIEDDEEEEEFENDYAECPNCHKKIDPDASECPYCGIKFEE